MFYLVTLLNRLGFQLFYFSSVQNVCIKVMVVLYIRNAMWFGTYKSFPGAGSAPRLAPSERLRQDGVSAGWAKQMFNLIMPTFHSYENTGKKVLLCISLNIF